MLAERLSPDSTATAVLSLHWQRLADYLRDHAAARPKVFQSIEDLLVSEARARSLTSDFRRRQDLPTVAELQRLGAKPDFAERLHREMRRVRAQQAASGSV
jgi:hypothetical protein